MLEIFCALYAEAKPLIEHLNLKKKTSFDSFINEEETIRLTLIGVGKIKAASTITTILNDSKDAFVLSYGSSACLKQTSTNLYIANKITDIDTGMCYYPDVLFATGIEECGFICGSQLYSNKDNKRASVQPVISIKEYLDSLLKEDADSYLYDMETSAIYEVANQYVGPERMMFVRFVSDNESTSVTANDVTLLSESVYPQIKQLIDSILSLPKNKQDTITDLEKQFYEHIHASKTMCDQIHQIVLYCLSANIDYKKVMKEHLQLEVNDKEEGKRVFDAFRNKCCEE